MHNITVPAALNKGSTIGIIAPAGVIRKQDDFAKGIRILHELGFITKFPRALWPGVGYLADADAERTREFNSIWADEEVEAIMAARGGYGCLRIADQLDHRIISAQPKLFIGFSDVTLLHNQLNSKFSLASLHGPVVTSLAGMSPESLKRVGRLMYGGLAHWQYRENIEILRGKGMISGISCGGNLTTIVSSLGTPFETTWRNRIVFLEDTLEPAYRIDRMFTQLKLCGKLDEASAIILGDFSHGLALDRISIVRHHDTIWRRLLELTDENTSIWGNFPIGHGAVNYPVPLGIEMILDNNKATLTAAHD